MQLAGWIAFTLVLVGCRGDGRAVDLGSGSPPPPPPSSSSPPPDATSVATTRSDAVGPVPPALARSVQLVRIANTFDRPVLALVAPGDARKRMFVLEQHTGAIKVLENGVVSPKRFATIGPLSKGNEQGLLGMAFHPQFATNHRVFVNYTDADDATRIVQLTTSATDPDTLDPASRKDIAKIDQPYSNHNGGHLAFGPDGKLYVGMGDGGSAGDPQRNGQRPTSLLGKILRFDVDAAAPRAEIVHLGVRNPWRFAFDTTGDLYIGDVGQNLWESVLVAPAGSARKNWGWNVVEGNHCYNAERCDLGTYTPAVAVYAHDEGCSITGGVVYRGKAFPALVGRYFYADFCTSLVRSFAWTTDASSDLAPGVVRDHWDWKTALDPDGTKLAQISSFGVDADGELYLVELTGAIYRLTPR